MRQQRCAAQLALLERLGPGLFTSMRRADQRRTAMLYVRGLLETPGRKSARNLARTVGGTATAQRFHHFVSVSPWDWRPVRRAVRRRLAEHLAPQAWIIRPSVFPRSGRQTVGLSQVYDPDHGRALHAQRAIGVWAASPGLSAPVDWQLLRPDHGEGPGRAPRMADGAGPLGPVDAVKCVSGRLLEDRSLAGRPVVLDARGLGSRELAEHLLALGVPFLLHVEGTLPLRSAAVPGVPATADLLLAEHHRSRRPVAARGRRRAATHVGALLPVVLDGPRTDPAGLPLVLLGLGEAGGAWPGTAWLTNIDDAGLPGLHALTLLADQTGHAFRAACATSGLRDFSGRSYDGWNRHLTLASAAHTISALGDLTAQGGSRTRAPGTARR